MKRTTTGWLLAGGIFALAFAGSLSARSGGLDPAAFPARLVSPAQMGSAAASVPGKAPGKPLPVSARPTESLPGKKPAGRTASVSADAKMADVRNRIDILSAARRAGLEKRPDLGLLRTKEAVDDLVRLQTSAGSSLRLEWRPETGTPRFLAGDDLGAERAGADPATSAVRFLERNKALLRLKDPAAEMVLRGVERDSRGFTAVRMDQVLNGVPVWAHDAVVRFDLDGRAIGFSGFYVATQSLPKPNALIDAAAATRSAVRMLRERAGVDASIAASELVYYPVNDELQLAWRHTATAGIAWRGEVFVDASTGEYLHHFTNIHTDGPASGSGIDLSNTSRPLGLVDVGGTFFMINTTKSMFNAGQSQFPDNPVGTINILDARNGDGSELFHTTSSNANNWTGFKNAVSAAFYAGQVFDYYDQRHDRNAIDGNGSAMWVVVNFQENFDNAFWNGQFMVFGNGNGTNFSDLAGALDVTAHEMSHGVIEHTANLVYEFQSGALNEHFADAFGASCEFFVEGAGGNWLLGEDVTTPATPNDALRDMEHPDGPKAAFGPQPAHMNQFQNLNADQDNGGVHINSGIPNRAFFLTADAIGVDKAERIWFRALSQHLVRNSQFVDFRLAVIQSAEELFGSTEVAAVTSAVDAVGITGGSGTPPPPPPPDNTGNDFVAVIDAEVDGHAYRTTPDLSAEFQDITGGEVGPGGRPSFSDDGMFYVFVGVDENIYAGDFAQATPLSDTGGFWSVALSADAGLLAATTIEEDGQIFVFDLVQSSNDRVYDLPAQNSTTGEVPDVVVFADVLDFPVEPGFLIYDALNRAQLASGTYEFWEINLLRLEDGEAFRVFPPLPVGESVGNPAFAQNNDNRIAFDYAASDGNIYCVGFDFQSGAEGIITNNFGSISRPTFSGDDGQVYYMFADESGSSIFNVFLEEDGVTGRGDDQLWATGGHSPVWFTVGQRPSTPVALLSLDGAWASERVSLSWRVADPGAYAGYHVARSIGDADFERRTERPIAAGAGDSYAFEEGAPFAESARYRIDGLTRSGEAVELGRISLRPEGASLIAPTLVASPNPFQSGARIAYRLPGAASDLRIAVYDVAGRLVKELPGGDVLADEGVVEWSGRDESGRAVPAGEYFVKLTAGKSTATARVVRLP